MKINPKFTILFAFLTLWACGDKKVDTTAVKEEMKAREVRVIPEAVVLEKALDLGNEAASRFELSTADTTQLLEGKIEINVSLFNEQTHLEGKEKMLFEAYQYNTEHQIKSDPNVQDLPDEKILLYTTPILTNGIVVGMLSVKFPRSYVASKIER